MSSRHSQPGSRSIGTQTGDQTFTDQEDNQDPPPSYAESQSTTFSVQNTSNASSFRAPNAGGSNPSNLSAASQAPNLYQVDPDIAEANRLAEEDAEHLYNFRYPSTNDEEDAFMELRDNHLESIKSARNSITTQGDSKQG
ncbi:hypothetical protein IAT40_004092 [Kwoniella sp. CBS 6097]